MRESEEAGSRTDSEKVVVGWEIAEVVQSRSG